MARSLRDELLKAGLVTSEQAARAERVVRRPSKPTATRARGRRSQGKPHEEPQGKFHAKPQGKPQDKSQDKSQGKPQDRPAGSPSRRRHRDRPAPRPRAPAPARPQALEPDERVRQLNLEIRRILDADAEPAQPEGDAPFHFPRGERLKRLYVSEDQRRRLSGGELAIVGFGGRHHLVPRRAGERVRELRPEVFVFIAADASEADPAAVDGYEGYEVPDELVW